MPDGTSRPQMLWAGLSPAGTQARREGPERENRRKSEVGLPELAVCKYRLYMMIAHVCVSVRVCVSVCVCVCICVCVCVCKYSLYMMIAHVCVFCAGHTSSF